MTVNDLDTDALLHRAGLGDDAARQQLLARHRARLRRMVAVRLDRRIAARVDPSDVVQEALTDAAGALDDYLRHRHMAFYPWLRQLTWERLARLHRHHIGTARRSVGREEPQELPLPGESVQLLADRLITSGTSPDDRLIRDELRHRVRTALDALEPRDREVLVLRYLEGLNNGEVAEILGITPGAVKVRHYRALERLRKRLDDQHSENQR